jgi:uncharacterized protein YecE (DUF72 family)
VIHVGCCGWQKAHATYFATYGLIEIQETFYKPPRVRTAERWRYEEAPAQFTFTLKAWQLITHAASSPTYRRARVVIPPDAHSRYGYFRPTDEVFEAWLRTKEIALTLRSPWVVFQCPASFTPTEDNKGNMRAFFGAIDRGDFRFAWEPRGAWADAEIAELCAELELVHCVDPFVRLPVTQGGAYFRLHGRGDYAYRYRDEELVQVRAWASRFGPVYVLFNNTESWDDGLRFRRLLGEAV